MTLGEDIPHELSTNNTCYLLCIGDYNTQVYRDYNKPILYRYIIYIYMLECHMSRRFWTMLTCCQAFREQT